MSVRELRHDRPSGWFSKSRRLSAFPSFLLQPLPALLLAPFFARSLTLVPRSFLLNRTETLATQASNCFIIHSKYFSVLKNLTSSKVFSNICLYLVKVSGYKLTMMFFSVQILLKNLMTPSTIFLCVLLHFFLSVLVRNSAIPSSDICERHFGLFIQEKTVKATVRALHKCTI